MCIGIMNIKEIKSEIARFYEVDIGKVEIKTNKKDLLVRVIGKSKRFVNLKILLNTLNRTYSDFIFCDGLLPVAKKRFVLFTRKDISQETLNKNIIFGNEREKKHIKRNSTEEQFKNIAADVFETDTKNIKFITVKYGFGIVIKNSKNPDEQVWWGGINLTDGRFRGKKFKRIFFVKESNDEKR